jgi:hypothetical protein
VAHGEGYAPSDEKLACMRDAEYKGGHAGKALSNACSYAKLRIMFCMCRRSRAKFEARRCVHQ